MQDPETTADPPAAGPPSGHHGSPLDQFLSAPLDASYREAAARRDAQGLRSATPLGRAGTVLAVALIGAGIAVAAGVVRPPDAARDPVRAGLVEQIEGAERARAALSGRNAEMLAEVDDMRASLISAAPSEVSSEARVALAGSAQLPLHGPALVITLADSGAAAAGEPDAVDGFVRDVDIQAVVNGLWAAGAEAIAVDDHRLSSTTAVRAAGRAILVNLAPVDSPYTIVALGDPGEMGRALEGTAAGDHLARLAQDYGIGVEVTDVDDAAVPPIGTRTPGYAEPISPAARDGGG